jgi:hypothetical protein
LRCKGLEYCHSCANKMDKGISATLLVTIVTALNLAAGGWGFYVIAASWR